MAESKSAYLRDIRDALNGKASDLKSGTNGETEAKYLKDIAKAIRSSGIDPSIPKVTDDDNGKILKVIEGVWAKGEESGGNQILFINGTKVAGSSRLTLDKTFDEIYDFVKDGTNTAIIMVPNLAHYFNDNIVDYFLLDHVLNGTTTTKQMRFSYIGNGLSSSLNEYTVTSYYINFAKIDNEEICQWREVTTKIPPTYTQVTGTLEAGDTELVLTNGNISTNSTFDIYTSIWGADPVSVSVSSGTLTLTFEEQESDMNVKVRVS